MKSLNIEYEWLNRVMPEGLYSPSSTLISGRGGTGKPLVAFALISSWLKNGGNVIMAPLQYPSPEFTFESMKRIYDLDLNKYKKRVLYVIFNPNINFLKEAGEMKCAANLLRPAVWAEINRRAERNLPKSDLGILFFGAALNLLMFSKTYEDAIFSKLKELVSEKKTRSYLFTVSTSAFKEKIEVLEKLSDNLLIARKEKPMKLFLKIIRLKNVNFSSEEIQVPFSKGILKEIKVIAESQRDRMIPIISKI